MPRLVAASTKLALASIVITGLRFGQMQGDGQPGQASPHNDPGKDELGLSGAGTWGAKEGF